MLHRDFSNMDKPRAVFLPQDTQYHVVPSRKHERQGSLESKSCLLPCRVFSVVYLQPSQTVNVVNAAHWCYAFITRVITYHTPWGEFLSRVFLQQEGHSQQKKRFLCNRTRLDLAIKRQRSAFQSSQFSRKSASKFVPAGVSILITVYGSRNHSLVTADSCVSLYIIIG